MSAQRLGRWLDVAWRGLYLVIGLATTGWGIYMGINGDEEAALFLAGGGLLMLAAAVWIRSQHPLRRAFAWVGIMAGIVPAAGLAVLSAWSASLAGPSFPGHVLDPEAVGVVVETRDPGQGADTYIIAGGREVELGSPAVELSGPGPGEGRLLIVASDGDTTFYAFLARDERVTTDPPCFRMSSGAGWLTEEGIVFSFGDIGLRLPMEFGLSPPTGAEVRLYRRLDRLCVAPDGFVRIHSWTQDL